ncbi:MAG: DotA/TraY family protein [Candidatus Thiodiazotropha sp. (ex. Lucinisca nassula)]|nr:DotA/TraY family protein [Candidatus Thiodiazotropha sp. (ex. Lucinisca nassula)]
MSSVVNVNIAEDLLLQIFGDYLNGEVTSVSTILAWIGTGAVAVFGVVLAYTVFRGVLETAHDGEVLGRRWSSLWVPFRMAFFSLTLFPIPGASGMPAIMVAILWCAGQASWLADQAWNQVVDKVAVAPVIHTPVPHARNSAIEILKMQTCAYGVARGLGFDEAPPVLNPQITVRGETIQSDDGDIPPTYTVRKTIAWPGDRAREMLGLHEDACGRVTFPIRTAQVIEEEGLFSTLELARDLNHNIRHDMFNANESAMDALIENLRSIAVESVYEQRLDVAAFNAAVANYAEAIKTGASQSVTNHLPNSVDQFRKDAKGAGWISSGVWWFILSRVQSNVSDVIRGIGVVTTPTTLDQTSGMWFTIADALNRVDTNIHAERVRNGFGSAPNPQPLDEDEDGWGILSSVAEALDETIRTSQGQNPLAQLQSMGDTILWTASGAGLVGLISPMASLIAFSLISFGILIGWVIPATPFIFFTLAFSGWLVNVIKTTAMGPIWSIQLANPNGSELSGMGGQGWANLFMLIATPVLILVGLILGYAAFMALSSFVQDAFWFALATVDGTSASSGMWKLIGSLTVYVSIIIALAYLCFGLVNQVPSAVAGWVNALADSGQGDSAQRAERGMATAGQQGSRASNASPVSGGAMKTVGSKVASRFKK